MPLPPRCPLRVKVTPFMGTLLRTHCSYIYLHTVCFTGCGKLERNVNRKCGLTMVLVVDIFFHLNLYHNFVVKNIVQHSF